MHPWLWARQAHGAPETEHPICYRAPLVAYGWGYGATCTPNPREVVLGTLPPKESYLPPSILHHQTPNV